MDKESLKKERQQLNKVVEQLAKYLNIAQEFTGDYLETLSLGTDVAKILERKGEKLKRIEAMIYVCRERLRFQNHEVDYDGDSFTIKVIHYNYPF